MVVISAPLACTASMRHDRAAAPSTSTVQAPHTPCSHPMWVPVRSRSSRRKSASVLRGSTVAARDSPLTVRPTWNVSLITPSRAGSGGCLLESPAHHYGGDLLPVGGRPVEIPGRIQRAGRFDPCGSERRDRRGG